MSEQNLVPVGSVSFGNDQKIRLIAGPCAMERRAHAMDVAGALKEMCSKLNLGLVFKTSFDKANRTSATGPRGVGIDDHGNSHASDGYCNVIKKKYVEGIVRNNLFLPTKMDGAKI